VADHLNRDQLGTLLFDLLTWDEAQDRENVFDIQFLASRLLAAVRYVTSQSISKDLPLGFFGASTGAGAALWAAADLGQSIQAVVSRGGRPDLALPRLNEVTAPTLLIVGGADDVVIALNQRALKSLKQGSMVIIPEANHLFEEPGALDQVSEHARRWFLTHFRS
jgi:putative phosphoribosyl transferase